MWTSVFCPAPPKDVALAAELLVGLHRFRGRFLTGFHFDGPQANAQEDVPCLRS